MKKYIGALLALLLLAGLILSANAINGKWRFSDDLSTLTNGDDGYEFYRLPNTFYWDPETLYTYGADIQYTYGSKTVELCHPEGSHDTVFVLDALSENIIAMYATEDGANAADSFVHGDYSKIRIRTQASLLIFNGFNYAEVKSDYYSTLCSCEGEQKTFDVSVMDKANFYEIIAYDSTDTIATVCGAIYDSDKGPYFIDYAQLDNTHFTADGEFSFRKGSVTMTKVEDTEFFESILSYLASSFQFRTLEILDDEDYIEDEDDVASSSLFSEGSAKIFIGFIIAITGYILPLIPTAIGFVLPHTKKHGYTKRWYWLSGLGLAWMALATFILLMLLL